jgi:multiple sugar transport system substrate-binding protein
MRRFFLGALLVLALMSLAAWKLQPPPAAAGKIPLVWVSDDNPARREQMALFNRLHPEIELRLDPNNTGVEKVIVQSLAGVGPDLFDSYGGLQLSAYVKSEVAWDVTDDLKRLGVDVGGVWPAARPCIEYEGRVYGFPTNVASDALWFNKDVFDEEGIPYPKGPWTWEEFIPLAQRLTRRDSSGRPQLFGLLTEFSRWQAFVWQWGGRLYSEDGTRCVIDSPEAIAGIQFLRDLVYKHRVMPSPVEEAAMATQGGWGTGTITLFGGGRSATAIGGRWWLCTLRGNAGLRLGAVEAPHGPKRVFHAYPRATLINRASPHRKEALLFLKYMSERPYNELINHQADALAPVVRYCETPLYLHDPAFPNEDFNRVWLETMRRSVPDQVSPFVSGQAATRIMTKQLDLVKADQKSPADAMRTAAREINVEIQKTLDMDPALRARYERLTRSARR